MAITGTGTQADPFVVTTYSELVSKITNPDSLSECYIKIGNDINIADEYPFGDMPILDFGVNVFLDGDGKTIKNWYYTGNDSLIKLYNKTDHSCKIENLNIANIVLKNANAYFLNVLATGRGSQTSEILVDNCTFVGELFGTMLSIQWENQNVSALRSCAFNLLLRNEAKFNRAIYTLPMESCNVKLRSEGNGINLIKTSNNNYIPKNCYFDISIPNGSTTSSTTIADTLFDNCVIKLATPLGSEASTKAKFGNSNTGLNVSIINTSASPGVEPVSATQLKEVTDQNWHNITYLQSIGFSAGERT